METLTELFSQLYDFVILMFDFALHANQYLPGLFAEYGNGILLILFLIIFCETGLVVMPFLPGDSLLFLTGALTAASDMNLFVVMLVLFVAAVIGDTVNYKIGSMFGHAILESKYSRFISRKALDKTHEYFEKYGGITIIIARFVPLVRTVAPFVAGITEMNYPRFLIYNVAGAAVWILLLLPAGYFFGQFEFVKTNISLIILGIIFVSVLPIIFGVLKGYLAHHKANKR